MLADTVYPIIQSLDKSEQFKLFKQLEKDLQSRSNNIELLSDTAKEKAKRIKWLKNRFFPPK